MKSLFLFMGVVILWPQAWAQIPYQRPEPLISDMVENPGFSYPFYNRQRQEYVKYRLQTTPTIEYVSRPFLKLAGIRIGAQNMAPVSTTYKMDLRYYDPKTKKDREIVFPEQSYIQNISWSPHGKTLAVMIEAPHCVELWIVEVPQLRKKKIPQLCLNTSTARDASFFWITSDSLLVLARDEKEVQIPIATPSGPIVKDSLGKVAQLRTYQDLLKTPQDAQAFKQVLQSRIQVISLSHGTRKTVFKQGEYSLEGLSPNKKWLLFSQWEDPYSYSVPFYLFKRSKWLISLDGKVKKNLGTEGPFESVPIQGVPTGQRFVTWDPSHPQRFLHVEALDGGDWKIKVPYRDQLVMNTITNAKGDIQTDVIHRLGQRFSGLDWLENASYGLFVYDYERDSKLLRYFSLKPEGAGKYVAKEFLRRNVDDEYKDPGELYKSRNEFDQMTATVHKNPTGEFVYWQGAGATPEGYRPFLSRMNLADFSFSEIFRSPVESQQNFWFFLDKDYKRLLMRVQGPTQAPQFEIRGIDQLQKPGELLFSEGNPYKIMTEVRKEIIRYKRKDGVEMTGTLYYPPGFDKNKKYPAVVSAYPLEYTDAKSAGQTRSVVNNFVIPSRASVLFFLLKGYLVLDEAQMPIVGHPETKNDSFIEQLAADAEATVLALEKTGFVDKNKIGIVGHSYGAFMVSHLLTHTKYFAAGIARSGAYNRTLTPFGFQGERRTFWEAKSTYLKMSTFLDAEKVKRPLLLIHGMDDNNSGTFTIQSERYFDALKGQGAKARLVLLPSESHGYAAAETVKHVLWESFRWFDFYLKGQPEATP